MEVSDSKKYEGHLMNDTGQSENDEGHLINDFDQL
jgi:hypothetical protein